MAHIEKCKGGEAGALIKHDERTQGEKDKHIDPALRHLNYNLCERGDSIKFMNSRIKEIMQEKTLRKDAVKAISLIITCPQDLPENEQEKFLQAAYDFAVKEYGKENIISAWVHRDEPGAMPHIHIKAVPVVLDKDTGKEKLSAKALITRAYLKQFHPKLQKYVEAELGHPVSIINGATAEKNKEIAELKAETAMKQVEEAERKLVAINAEYEPKKAYVEAFARVQESITEDVKEHKTITGKKQATMPLDKWERYAMSFADREAVLKMQGKVERLIEDFQSSAAGEKYQELVRELEQWQDYATRLNNSNNRMAEDIKRINTVFEKYPEIKERFFEAEEQIKAAEKRSKTPNKTSLSDLVGEAQGEHSERNRGHFKGSRDDIER